MLTNIDLNKVCGIEKVPGRCLKDEPELFAETNV